MNAAQVILDVTAIALSSYTLISHYRLSERFGIHLANFGHRMTGVEEDLKQIVQFQQDLGLEPGTYAPRGKSSDGEQEFHKMMDFKELDDIIKGKV